MAIISKGVTLKYKSSSSSSTYDKEVLNLQSFPDLGVAPNNLDCTTLADSYMHYTPGLKDLGTLEFTMLFDSAQYNELYLLEEAGTKIDWQVEFPDATASTGHGTQFNFSGKCSVAATGKGVNEVLQATLSIFIETDITVDPAT